MPWPFGPQWWFNDPAFGKLSDAERKRKFPTWVNPRRKMPHWGSRACAALVLSIPVLDVWSLGIYFFHEYPVRPRVPAPKRAHPLPPPPPSSRRLTGWGPAPPYVLGV